MTRVLRSLNRRISVLLLSTVVATGCSHNPISPTDATSLIPAGFLSVGALQKAKIELHEEDKSGDQSALDCPGPGTADCEYNWRHLSQGITADEVVKWLGEPSHQVGPEIYVEKVVAQWQYQHSGVVYFENEELRFVDMPESFDYSL